jgi:hypothetical protein
MSALQRCCNGPAALASWSWLSIVVRRHSPAARMFLDRLDVRAVGQREEVLVDPNGSTLAVEHRACGR